MEINAAVGEKILEAFPESEMAEEYRILAKAILMKVREKQEVSNA